MSHASSAALSRRHHAIRAAMAERGLDALVVTSLPNILYLTNFTGSSAIVVLTRERLHFVTDFRYVTVVTEAQASPAACPGLELTVTDGSYDATLAALVDSQPGRIGIESPHLTVNRYDWLQKTLAPDGGAPRTLVLTEGIVERARARKDAGEIATLREAASMLSRVARSVLGSVARGQSEREVALAIDTRIRQEGFERSAFDTIVASGPNAALPHAHPGGRILSEGDLVVLDFGGVYASYCVDLTRTVSVGRAGARAREVYGAVLAARNQAVAAVAPAVSRFDIDAAARDTLVRHGLGEAFGHGTGHGLGLEVHEDPRITRRRPDVDVSDELVEAGMVFTIEPGAYLAGWGGVRIEDDVLVTDTGVEVLTDVPTELLEI
ncbi:MAG TPA: Xaa-Pro peptidase family protein [Vicinamibacterales bacterium]|nr:Xaa-Pro peptidase family protein [Vicinamibacterales bacterium]